MHSGARHWLFCSALAACRGGAAGLVTSEPQTAWAPDAGTTAVPALDAVPTAWIGRWVEGQGVVTGLPDPQGFWIGTDDQRLLVLLHHPNGLLKLAPGDRVQVMGRLLSPLVDGALPADLDPALRDTALHQDRFLLADGEDVASWTSSAVSPPPPVPERWDADRDDVVSRGELRAALADDPRVLASDRDEDQALAPSELLGLAFEDWDVDHDGVVTSEEWSRGRRAWLGSAVRDPFDHWDRDRSGRLERGEVERGLREAGLPRAYDTDHDGSVSLDELATTLVAVSDVDRDADLRVVELDALGAGCLAQPPERASIPVSQDPAVAGIPDRDR